MFSKKKSVNEMDDASGATQQPPCPEVAVDSGDCVPRSFVSPFPFPFPFPFPSFVSPFISFPLPFPFHLFILSFPFHFHLFLLSLPFSFPFVSPFFPLLRLGECVKRKRTKFVRFLKI